MDETVALAFDMKCAAVLFRDEQEREAERLAAHLTALATGTMPKRIKIETEKFNEQNF